jgi:PPOX class probable F420-dependent enzyme
MALTEKQRSFIADNPYAGVVTTLRPDGSPHSTIVWVDVVGDNVEFNTAVGRAKERHLRNDPRLSLTVVDPADQYRWVSVSGRAELLVDGADPQIDRLAKKYIGKDEYPFRSPDEQRITVRIKADRVDGRGLDG